MLLLLGTVTIKRGNINAEKDQNKSSKRCTHADYMARDGIGSAHSSKQATGK